MNLTSIARRTGRSAVMVAFSLATVSLVLPETAYARHDDGAATALGILGGAFAGAAISSGAAPGYYAAPPVYYYPYAPPAYVVAPPAYYYVPPAAAYYAPAPYYGPQYYGPQYFYGGY